MSVTILAIESSCDDTSAAVIRDGYLLSNLIAGQSIHMEYGGVVPELASRAHQANIVPVTDTALKKAGVRLMKRCSGFYRGQTARICLWVPHSQRDLHFLGNQH